MRNVTTEILRRRPTEREVVARNIYERLSPAMSVLGVIFLLIVLGQALVADGGRVHTVFVAVAWVIWAVFVVEFAARLVIAPSTAAFLKKNWWQLLFLLIPFLSFVRGLLLFRLSRSARVLLAAVRGTRTAKQKLTSRIGWLSGTTVVVILAAANLLYEFGDLASYPDALHAAAMTAISGEATGSRSFVGQILDVVLAVYSVVFFASLAGMLGAFFLERRAEHAEELRRPTGAGAI